jgi:hypothetical protein
MSPLLLVAACANTMTTASNDAPGFTRVAGTSAGGSGTNSVAAVSDALGQRLDGMLSSRQTGGSPSR